MHTARNLLRRTAAALGGLALLGLTASCSGRSGETAPSVILVTVDTLRADRVGLYGGGAAPTPHMDRIGREGAFVETAVTPVGRTTQAVATILTGLHPFRHGVEGLDITLPLEMTTLAERFRARGYRTAAFVSNVNLAPGRNFEQGFEIYRNPGKRWKGNSADAISREAIEWVERSKPAGPIFLWVHYLDPHWPYEPAAEFSQRTDPDWHGTLDIVERQDRHEISKGQILYSADRLLDARSLEHVRRLYDAEVAATDAAIGVLLEGLGQHGLLDDSILGFTADHGEAMGEHGYWFGHGDYLYDET
ncbi:MAG: sulfatase, partial [Candidatus Binatia bacterium]